MSFRGNYKMDKEFERMQKQVEKQIKELESKKISRQKNQATVKYKTFLKKRREFDEQIMILEEQKNIISNDNVNFDELKDEFNLQFEKKLEKLENDKNKMSKRTYQRNRNSLINRHNAKISALEGLKQEFLQTDREQMKADYDAKIKSLIQQRKENEEEISKLKIENETRNLKIDRAIYYINKTHLNRAEKMLAKLNKEIEVLNISMSQELTMEQSISKLKQLSTKQDLAEQYSEQIERLKTRNEKFTKKTLQKIANLKPNTNKKEVEEKPNLSKNVAEATDVKKQIKLDEMLFSPIRRENKRQENQMIKEISIKLIANPSPHLQYSTFGEDGRPLSGHMYYNMKRNKTGYMSMTQSYDEVSENVEENVDLDAEILGEVDPFLLDYLSNTNAKMYGEVLKELKKGKGLGKFAEIIHYDMTNADELKRRDKKSFRTIVKKAEKSGLTVIGYQKKPTLLGRMIDKFFNKKEEYAEIETTSEEINRNIEKTYKKQFEFIDTLKEPNTKNTKRPIRSTMNFMKEKGAREQ